MTSDLEHNNTQVLSNYEAEACRLLKENQAMLQEEYQKLHRWLMRKSDFEALVKQGHVSYAVSRDYGNYDPRPVIKLFTPDAQCTWLLSEIYPSDLDIGFGLCDLGMGFPELGNVSFTELVSVRGKLGLSIERDHWFEPKYSIAEYAALAVEHQRIVKA